jgi:hypothetical protein
MGVALFEIAQIGSLYISEQLLMGHSHLKNIALSQIISRGGDDSWHPSFRLTLLRSIDAISFHIKGPYHAILYFAHILRHVNVSTYKGRRRSTLGRIHTYRERANLPG